MTSSRTVAARKPAKRAASKRVAKTTTAPETGAGKPAAQEAAAKAQKPPKIKLVRDSFTIPKTEYSAIDALKRRAARAGLPSKKSELLRAGLMALSAMGDASFQAAMDAVPRLKTGRPKKH